MKKLIKNSAFLIVFTSLFMACDDVETIQLNSDANTMVSLSTDTVILTEDPGSKDLLTIADKRYFLNGMPTRVANKMRDLGLTGYRAVPKTGKNRDYHKGFEGLSVQEVRAFELKVAKKILGEHCK